MDLYRRYTGPLNENWFFSYKNDLYHTYGNQHAYPYGCNPYGRNKFISKSMSCLVKKE